jgi:secreted trypsin-like serine protease
MNTKFWLALVFTTAACEGSAARIESGAQPIVAGTPNPGDPAIMSLLSFKGAQGARCTASLITPRLLIAAAHCITETPGYTQRQIFTGSNDLNGGSKDTLAIKTVVVNPAYGAPRQGNDFSLIVLETPLALPPMRLNRAALTGAQGKTVRYVGYGISVVGNLGTGGVKRHNTAPLAEVSNLLLTVGPNANQSCEGDSGGPLLLDRGDDQGEVIIGINSFVDAPACRRNSFFQRVDTQLAWIDEQIKKYDPDMVPPQDAGAADVSAMPDVAPEISSKPDVSPADIAPTPEPDAGGAPAPSPRDAAPPPEPAPAPASAEGGGCRFSGTSAGPSGSTALLAVALACLVRRRRRRAN